MSTSPKRKRVVRPRIGQHFYFLSAKDCIIVQTNHSLALRACIVNTISIDQDCGWKPQPPSRASGLYCCEPVLFCQQNCPCCCSSICHSRHMSNAIKLRSLFSGLAIFALTFQFGGCGSTRLDLGPPGTIGMQRERAVIHDPFPSNDLGPPIVGGRPAGFDLPLAPTKNLQVNPHAINNKRGGYVQPYGGF